MTSRIGTSRPTAETPPLEHINDDVRARQLSSGAVKIDHESPLFLLYTAVASAIAVVIVYWLFNDGEIDWLMVVLLAVAAVVGVLIASRTRRRRA
jgi:hypothetical protein